MENAVRRIADMLQALADASAAWIATGNWRPETWSGLTWGLVAALVVLTWLLAWRRRTPRALDVRPPQLLVTSGEVVPDGVDEDRGRAPGRRRRRVEPEVHAAAGTFTMTVSNLSRYPVQLLEVALRDGRRGAARVATVEAVVPAMGSVVVAGRVGLGLRGDGWLDVYCYAAAPRVKTHRHRVELVWEPWAGRFKAAPMEQVSAPTRRLASDEPDARFLEDEPDVLGAADGAFVDDRSTPTPGAPDRGTRAAAEAAVPRPAAPTWNPRVPDRPAADRTDVDRPAATPSPVGDRAPTVPASSPPASSPPASSPPASSPPASSPPAPRPPASRAPLASPPAERPQVSSPTEARPHVSSPPAAPRARPPEGAPSGERRPSASAAEPLGVPRIATPPVGVAVAGRGGASARTSQGLPIGRPTARSERGPAMSATDGEAEAEGFHAPTAPDGAPAPVDDRLRPVADAAGEPSDDAPAHDPPVRRRPRLEFPDEF